MQGDASLELRPAGLLNRVMSIAPGPVHPAPVQLHELDVRPGLWGTTLPGGVPIMLGIAAFEVRFSGGRV